MPAFELEEQTASVEVHVNPLVNWVWAGFAVMAIGTGIALLPEGAVSFAAARLPAQAVTASLVVVALLLGAPVARAQHVEGKNPQLQVFSPEVRQTARQLACWCGGCSKLPVGECTCGHCALVKTEIAALLKEGKGQAEIIRHYVEPPADHLDDDVHRGQRGQLLLSEPVAGIGRLVWLIPYALGAAGALAAGRLALTWSRRTPALAGAPGTLDDEAALAARLDDELRELE
jgi:cytochrome c-type biogenesis protein CcmF